MTAAAIERLRVSEGLGQRIDQAAAATGVTLHALLEGAICHILDDADRQRAAAEALAPRRAKLTVGRVGMVVIAVYDGRFAGVGVDVGHHEDLVLDWCDWFRALCVGAGVKLRQRRVLSEEG